LEDLAVPRMHLSVFERAVYSHLLRHSRLEVRLQLCFSIPWLARGAGLSLRAARKAVRGLAAKGALRLAERSGGPCGQGALAGGDSLIGREQDRGLPGGVCLARGTARRWISWEPGRCARRSTSVRAGQCFYCLRRLRPMVRCLDHVVARARGGGNGYRNLVSSCAECNSQKGKRRAEDFLRWLWREGRLSAGELSGRLRALARLAAGKLRPALRESAGAHNPRFLSQRDGGKCRQPGLQRAR